MAVGRVQLVADLDLKLSVGPKDSALGEQLETMWKHHSTTSTCKHTQGVDSLGTRALMKVVLI